MRLKEKAVTEYRNYKPVATMKAQLDAITKAFERCVEWFGEIPDRAEAGTPTMLPFVECDGLQLHYCDRDDAFRLKYQCPLCKATCHSPSFRTPYELGKYLDMFVPHPHPYCDWLSTAAAMKRCPACGKRKEYRGHIY